MKISKKLNNSETKVLINVLCRTRDHNFLMSGKDPEGVENNSPTRRHVKFNIIWSLKRSITISSKRTRYFSTLKTKLRIRKLTYLFFTCLKRTNTINAGQYYLFYSWQHYHYSAITLPFHSCFHRHYKNIAFIKK